MINKNLLIELSVMICLFIGLDTFIFIKKDSIEFLIVMIFFECFVMALLALCLVVDERDRRCQR